MPELPEVETIARRLRKVLPGKTIAQVEVLRQKSFGGDAGSLSGVQIQAVERRSKILSLLLSNKQHLLIHLKMTGQLLYVDGAKRLGGGHPTDDFIDNLPSKHTRVAIRFTDATTLFFNDLRVFGWIHLVDDEGKQREMTRLAPDIIDAAVTPAYLFEKLTKCSQAIKVVIMDNSVVAGVGNIYACDALHLAKINPLLQARSLSYEEVERLLAAMKKVISLGIERGGATIQHYKNVDGLVGTYQDIRRVYAREGEPCQNCGMSILRIKQAGRSTFYCPSCQK